MQLNPSSILTNQQGDQQGGSHQSTHSSQTGTPSHMAMGGAGLKAVYELTKMMEPPGFKCGAAALHSSTARGAKTVRLFEQGAIGFR